MRTTESATPTAEAEAEMPKRTRRKTAIVFRPFTGIPTNAALRCLDLSDAALRLWLALALASKGRSKTVTVTNADLMATARVTKNAFNPAREELVEAKVLTASATDGRKTTYVYDLAPVPRQPPVKRRANATRARFHMREGDYRVPPGTGSWGPDEDA
jgi:hypothetical protein